MSDKDLMSVIKNLNEKWMSDFSKGDAVSVGSHYTEDAVSLAPGCKPIVGKEAIIEY
jgi:ketosteroid isomerase-like protein